MRETLSTLGQHFGQLLELALTWEVQVSTGWAGEKDACGDSSVGSGWAEGLGLAGGSSEVACLGGHLPQSTKVN